MSDDDRHYSPEFKASLVLDVIRRDDTASSLAESHGVHPVTLSRWKTKLEREAPSIFSKETDLKDCHRQLEGAREELEERRETIELLRDILSHTLSTDQKVEWVNRYRDSLGLNCSCELLDLPKSTYYYRMEDRDQEAAE